MIMNEEKIAENLCSAYSKIKIDENFISKTKEKILLDDDIQYYINEPEKSSVDVDAISNIKQKFVIKPRFILNAIASVVIIAILLNVAFFKGVFNKNVIPIGPVANSSSVPMATQNNNDSKKTPAINTTLNSTGRIMAGDGSTILFSIIKSKDGGFVTVGHQGKSEGSYAIIKKFDNAGNIEWSKNYGGKGFDGFKSVIQTDDGGYIAVGSSIELKTFFNLDAVIYKIDGEGNIVWSKTLGDMDISNINIDVKRLTLNKIIQTVDKGFVIVGDLNNFKGAIMIKLNSSGNKIWEVIYNGSLGASFTSVKQSNDGGLLVIGGSSSIDGDFIDKESAGDFGIIVKFDSSGKKLWSKYSSFSFAYGSILQVSNGEILVCGMISDESANTLYATLTKYSNDGNKLWEKNYKESLGMVLSDIFKTDENSIIGVSDPYICKFDNNGNILWKNKYCEDKYGDENYIQVLSIIQSTEEGYVACGKGYADLRACIFFFDSNGKLK